MEDRIIAHAVRFGLIAVLGLLICLVTRTRPNWKWLLTSFALIIVHDALLTRAYGNIDPFLQGLSWNWTGKILAMAGGVLMVFALGRKACGLTLSQNKEIGSALWVCASLTIVAFVASYIFRGTPGSAEAIVFQLTMPGFEEEIFYRGVLLLTLTKAFPIKWKILNAETSPAFLLTAVLFGLVHGLNFSESGFNINQGAALFSFVSGLVFVWLREKTGSLLLPIYMHNVWNTAFTVI